MPGKWTAGPPMVKKRAIDVNLMEVDGVLYAVGGRVRVGIRRRVRVRARIRIRIKDRIRDRTRVGVREQLVCPS